MKLEELESKYFFHTYDRIPIEISHGDGLYLFSKDGKKYLDMFGGLAVNALGYGNPKILQAISEQIKKYIHLSNFYLQEPQIRLAELILKHSGYKKVFFCNSGTEAIEGAIKIIRKWGKSNGKSDIIAFQNGFHGRTYGALSIMDRIKYREFFGPFLSNCSVIPYNDVVTLNQSLNKNTSAIILEFIQGESGIIQAKDDFVSELKRLKEMFGFLLVADEIQSGLGRTGKLFSFQHYNITPDIVVIAKSLGGGLPLGAILGNEMVADVFQPGEHGSTFGGNPVACSAGIAFLNEIFDNNIMKNVEKMGKYFITLLIQLKSEFPSIIRDVRGTGLMIGVELFQGGEPISNLMREKGILINCTNKKVLRFLPPLIIQEEHINFVIENLRNVLKHS